MKFVKYIVKAPEVVRGFSVVVFVWFCIDFIVDFGIIELLGWLFSKKFIYQSKFSMFF
jgi:hypothetical protein